MKSLPTIDMVKTGEKIENLRKGKGLTVRSYKIIWDLIHHNPYISGKKVKLCQLLTIW